MTQRTELERAHQRSIRHRAEIEASDVCGCFYCLATFALTAGFLTAMNVRWFRTFGELPG